MDDDINEWVGSFKIENYIVNKYTNKNNNELKS